LEVKSWLNDRQVHLDQLVQINKLIVFTCSLHYDEIIIPFLNQNKMGPEQPQASVAIIATVFLLFLSRAVVSKNFPMGKHVGKVQNLRPPSNISLKSFNFSIYYIIPMGIQVTTFE